MEGAETALRILNNTELDGRKIFLRKVGWCLLVDGRLAVGWFGSLVGACSGRREGGKMGGWGL